MVDYAFRSEQGHVKIAALCSGSGKGDADALHESVEHCTQSEYGEEAEYEQQDVFEYAHLTVLPCP
jgi:hypothetical protein